MKDICIQVALLIGQAANAAIHYARTGQWWIALLLPIHVYFVSRTIKHLKSIELSRKDLAFRARA